MATGKGKNCQKFKILTVLKSAHQKLLGIVQSKLKISSWEIHYIKRDTLLFIAAGEARAALEVTLTPLVQV